MPHPDECPAIDDLTALLIERGPAAMASALAVAEMYVQSVSTRQVTTVVQELYGLDITSTQVSRAAAELDEQLGAWRNFLDSLVARGMHGVKLVASDDHAGLKAARQAVLAGVP